MPLHEIHWSEQLAFPLLGLLQLLPLLAMGWFFTRSARRHPWRWALLIASLELGLAMWLLIRFQPLAGTLQFSEQFSLLGPFGYHAAADGMTVIFVLLNAFLTLMVLAYGQVRRLMPAHQLIAAVFAVEFTAMSLLVTVDLLWFSLMSALQLAPVGYLVWRWASAADKDLALTRFLQYMGVGVLLLFAGTLMLGWNYADISGEGWSFDLLKLMEVAPLAGVQSFIFFLLFYGMAIRTPLFPLHGWLPKIAEHGSIAVAPVCLLGLKTGIYGMLRFVFPLLPEAVVQWHPFVVAFALAGVFYAALLALLQDNIRRLLAFAVVSHTSLLVIGLFTLGTLSFQGSILLAVNFGLAIAALFFMSGMVYRRTGSLLLSRIGGLFDRIPLLGIAFLVAGLSIIGMPGTPGFDAVHLVLEDAMHRFGALVTIAAALGNVVAAGFLLIAFQRAFLAPAPATTASSLAQVEPASRAEILIAVVFIVMLMVNGFYSEPWMRLVETTAQDLGAIYSPLLGGEGGQ